MSRARQKQTGPKAASRRRSSAAKTDLLPKLVGKRSSSNPAAQKLLRGRGFRDVGRVLAAIGRLQADALERRNLREDFPAFDSRVREVG